MDLRKINTKEMGRPGLDEFRQLDKIHIVVLLNNIRSMLNLGSVFRTADAFVIEKLILCGITAKPPHRDIQKTALGATESVEWQYFEDASQILNQYKKEKYVVIAVEQTTNSVKLQDFEFQKSGKYVLLLGNEVEGVDEKLLKMADLSLEIPQSGTKHSLNVAVSAGIVLWQAYKDLHL